MGIPSYFSFIVKSHRNIIKELSKKDLINNLYLDSNSIIYDVIVSLSGLKNDLKNVDDIEKLIMLNVCKKISEYIMLLSPNNKVLIAFDGVAPVAKLCQQRNRRYKASFQRELLLSLGISKEFLEWDTCSITPGTKFMNDLGVYISDYFDSNKLSLCVKEVIVSSSNLAGEGEHKIFKYIRDNMDYHLNTKTVIYGLDADLIMLSLNHLYISRHIYLFRETPHFIKSIDATLNPYELYIMDIPCLGDAIINNMLIGVNNNYDMNESKNIISDYILICFLLGNDFLPHFPSLNIRTNGIQILIDVYKDTFIKLNRNVKKKEFLTLNNKIIWKNLRLFILNLSKLEEKNFINEVRIRDNYEKFILLRCKTVEDNILNIPMLDRNIEKYINVGDLGWEYRYYKMLLNVDIDDIRKKQICMNYLEGLEWVFSYYISDCKDWRWKYNYAYSPLLKDLVEYIPYFNVDLIDNNLYSRPIDALVQLCYVLPRSGLFLLPPDLYNYYLEKYNYLYESDYKFIWSFCKYFWESHVIMPDINIIELENFLLSYMDVTPTGKKIG